jgi:hypothetical protein
MTTRRRRRLGGALDGSASGRLRHGGSDLNLDWITRPCLSRSSSGAKRDDGLPFVKTTALHDYPCCMTREEAIAEAARRRISHPEATWLATQRGTEWTVARIGLASHKPTGTATKPPPVAPQDDPHSPSERAAWFAAGG